MTKNVLKYLELKKIDKEVWNNPGEGAASLGYFDRSRIAREALNKQYDLLTPEEKASI